MPESILLMGNYSSNEKSVVVFFSLFKLKPGFRWWGLRQMGLAKNQLKKQKELSFGKLMGTGKGRGFSIIPDFDRYALFTCWKEEEAAQEFFKSSMLVQGFKQNSLEMFRIRLLPFLAKGNWEGNNPLLPLATKPAAYEGPVVALTRAGIRWQRLAEFWSHVPGVSKNTGDVNGLLAQTGMGELPVVQQATFSVWQNEQCLQEFAYKMRQHQEVIKKTRSRNWYSEELFARFIPLEAEGSWDGSNPLAGYLSGAGSPNLCNQ